VDGLDKSVSFDDGGAPRRSTLSLGATQLNDRIISLGAASLELGLPLTIALLSWRIPKLRSRLVVLLGTLTPALLFYTCVFVARLADLDNLDGRWALYAVWVMSFLPYMSALIIGLAVSFSGRPRRYVARYALGLLCAPIAYVVLMVVANWASGA
jgi:hypothetical protein